MLPLSRFRKREEEEEEEEEESSSTKNTSTWKMSRSIWKSRRRQYFDSIYRTPRTPRSDGSLKSSPNMV
jgi:hypothetical protein